MAVTRFGVFTSLKSRDTLPIERGSSSLASMTVTSIRGSGVLESVADPKQIVRHGQITSLADLKCVCHLNHLVT